MKYCTQCGAPNEDRATFCTSCGNPLTTPEPQQAAAPPPPPPPPEPEVPQQAYAPPPPQAYPPPPPQQPYPPQQAYPPPPDYGFPHQTPPKKKKTGLIIGIVAAVVVVAIVLVLVLGGGGGGKSGINGKWTVVDTDGWSDYEEGLVFNFKGGKLTFEAPAGTPDDMKGFYDMMNLLTTKYTVKGDTLTLAMEFFGEKDETEYRFKVEGDTLTLFDEDGDVTVLKRAK